MSNVNPNTGKFDDEPQDGLVIQDPAALMGELEKTVLTPAVADELKKGIDTAVTRDNNLKQVLTTIVTVLKAAAGIATKACITIALCLPMIGCGVSPEFVAVQKVSNSQIAVTLRNMDRERAGWSTALLNAENGHAATLYHAEWNKAVDANGLIKATDAQAIMGRYQANLVKIQASVQAGVVKGQQNSADLAAVLGLQNYLVAAEEKQGKFDAQAFAAGLVSIGQAGVDAYKALSPGTGK